jgi:hypothetical protein
MTLVALAPAPINHRVLMTLAALAPAPITTPSS